MGISDKIIECDYTKLILKYYSRTRVRSINMKLDKLIKGLNLDMDSFNTEKDSMLLYLIFKCTSSYKAYLDFSKSGDNKYILKTKKDIYIKFEDLLKMYVEGDPTIINIA